MIVATVLASVFLPLTPAHTFIMSFLLLEDDRVALEEALAFIDAHADALPALGSLSSPSPPSSPSPAPPPAPPKRVRDPSVYARRRLKKKAELQALRLQAKSLETQLAQQRRSLAGHKPLLTADDVPPTDGDVTSDGSVSSPATSESTKTLARRRQRQARRTVDWFMAAVSEHKRRRAAEQLNAQLRAALEAQVALTRRFQGFLDGYSAPEVRILVVDPLFVYILTISVCMDRYSTHRRTAECR